MDAINPDYYKKGLPRETIEYTEMLGFSWGNAFKYLTRAGKKDGQDIETELDKAEWYLHRYLRPSSIKPTPYKVAAKELYQAGHPILCHLMLAAYRYNLERQNPLYGRDVFMDRSRTIILEEIDKMRENSRNNNDK